MSTNSRVKKKRSTLRGKVSPISSLSSNTDDSISNGKRYIFKNIGDQIASISYERILSFGGTKATSLGSHTSKPSEGSSWFILGLGQWRELNCTAPFAHFYSTVIGHCGSLPAVIFNQKLIFDALIDAFLIDTSGVASAPLSALSASLVKDLGENCLDDVLCRVLPTLLKVVMVRVSGSSISSTPKPSKSRNLKLKKPKIDNASIKESLEVVLGSTLYIIRYILPLVEDYNAILEHLLDVLSKNRNTLRSQVKDFIAEFAGFVLLKSSINPNIYKSMLKRTILNLEDEKVAALVLAASTDGNLGNLDSVLSIIDSQEITVNLLNILLNRKIHNGQRIVQRFIDNLCDNFVSLSSISHMLHQPRHPIKHYLDTLLGGLFQILTVGSPENRFNLSIAYAILETVKSVANLNMILAHRANLAHLLRSNPTHIQSMIASDKIEVIDCVGIKHDEIISSISDSIHLLHRYITAKSIPVSVVVGNFLMERLLTANPDEACLILEMLRETLFEPVDYIESIPVESLSLLKAAGGLLISKSKLYPAVLNHCIEQTQVGALNDALSAVQILTSFADAKVLSPDSLSSILDSLVTSAIITSNPSCRLLVLRLIKSLIVSCRNYSTQLEKDLDICLMIEEIPWTFNCDREKGIHMMKLNRATSKLTIGYLFGLLVGDFQPINRHVHATLSSVISNNQDLARETFKNLLDKLESLQIESWVSPIFVYLSKNPNISNIILSTHIVYDFQATSNGVQPMMSMILPRYPYLNSILMRKRNVAKSLDSLSGCTSISRLSHVKDIVYNYLQSPEISIQRAAINCFAKLKFCTFDYSIFERCLRLLASDTRDVSAELLTLSSKHEKIKDQSFLPILVIPILTGRITYHACQKDKSLLKIIVKYICSWDNTLIASFINHLSLNGRVALQILENLVKTLGRLMGPDLFLSVVNILEKFYTESEHILKNSPVEDHDLKMATRTQRSCIKLLNTMYSINYEGSSDKADEATYQILSDRLKCFGTTKYIQFRALLELLATLVSHQNKLVYQHKDEILSQLAVALTNKTASTLHIELILDIWLNGALSITNRFSSLINSISSLLKTIPDGPHSHSILDKIIQILFQVSKSIFSNDAHTSCLEPNLKTISNSIVESFCSILLNRKFGTEDLVIQVIKLLAQMQSDDTALEIKTTSIRLLETHTCNTLLSRANLASLLINIGETELGQMLQELHAPNESRIDEYDYERQMRAFSNLKILIEDYKFDDEAALSSASGLTTLTGTRLLFNLIVPMMMFFMLNEDDTAGRTQARLIISMFIEKLAKTPSKDKLILIVDSLKRGLSSKSGTIRFDFVKLLATAVDRLYMVEPFKSIKWLVGDVKTVESLVNIQVHVRIKAFSDLEKHFNRTILAPHYHAETNRGPQNHAHIVKNLTEGPQNFNFISELDNLPASEMQPVQESIQFLMIPLFKAMLIDCPTDSRAEASQGTLFHSITRVLSCCYAALPVSMVLKFTDRALQRFKSTSSKTLQKRVEMKLLPAIFDHESLLLRMDDFELIKSLESLGTLLAKNDTGLNGSSTKKERHRSAVALAMGSLISGIRDESLKGLHREKVLTLVASNLANRFEDQREICRQTFIALAQKMNVSLYTIVPMLKVAFAADNRSHVIAYTLNCVLKKCEARVLFNEKNLPNETVTLMMNILKSDMFGDGAKQKSDPGWTGRNKIPEAREETVFDSFRIISQHVDVSLILPVLVGLILEVDGDQDLERRMVGKAFTALETAIIARLSFDKSNSSTITVGNNTDNEKCFRNGASADNSTLMNVIYTMLLCKDNLLSTRLSRNSQSANRMRLAASRILSKLDVSIVKWSTFLPLITTNIFHETSMEVVEGSFQTLMRLIPYKNEDEEFIISDEIASKLLVRAVSFKKLSGAAKFIACVVSERPNAQLGEVEIRELLKIDLEADGNVIAYAIIKAILKRTVQVIEVFDLMRQVSRTMIRSLKESVRQQCRTLYQVYVSRYSKVSNSNDASVYLPTEQLTFLLANLDFSMDGGRRSVVVALEALISALDDLVIEKMADTLWLTLTERIANEENIAILETLLSCVRRLIKRLNQRTRDRLLGMMEKWLNSSNEAAVHAAWRLSASFKSLDKADCSIVYGIYFKALVANVSNNDRKLVSMTREQMDFLITSLSEENCVSSELVQKIVDFAFAVLEKYCTVEGGESNDSFPKVKSELDDSDDKFEGKALQKDPNFTIEMRPLQYALMGLYFNNEGIGHPNWSRRMIIDLQLLSTSPLDTDCAEQIIKNLVHLTKDSPLPTLAALDRIHGQKRNNYQSPQFEPSILKYAAVILTIQGSLYSENHDGGENPMIAGNDENHKELLSHIFKVLHRISAKNEAGGQVLMMIRQIEELADLKYGQLSINTRVEVSRLFTKRSSHRRSEVARLAISDPQAFSKRRLQMAERRKRQRQRSSSKTVSDSVESRVNKNSSNKKRPKI